MRMDTHGMAIIHIYSAVCCIIGNQPLAIPPVTLQMAPTLEAYKRNQIYRHCRGTIRWLESKLPNCIVTGTVEQQPDGWVIEMVVRQRADKDGEQ